MEYTQFKPIRTSAPRPDPQPLARQDSGSEEPGFFSRLFGLGRPDKTGPTEAPAPAKAKVRPVSCFLGLFVLCLFHSSLGTG